MMRGKKDESGPGLFEVVRCKPSKSIWTDIAECLQFSRTSPDKAVGTRRDRLP